MKVLADSPPSWLQMETLHCVLIGRRESSGVSSSSHQDPNPIMVLLPHDLV